MKNIVMILGVAALCGGFATTAGADTVYLTSDSRAVLHDYVISKNGGCPPGSTRVKEDHWFRGPTYSCVVPKGSNVVFYKPGTVIPETVHYEMLPTTVIEKLPTPPSGEVYVTADNNVYLVQPETRTVVEAVTLVGPAE